MGITTASGDLSREWFAAQVCVGREHVCRERLAVRGYEAFLPSYREHRRWSDRIKTVDRALFPGYVFCRLFDAVVGKVVTTPGVIRIVGDGSRPIPIAAHEIVALQRIVEAGVAAEPWEFLRVGQAVSIAEGPLRGVEGIILRANSRQRLIVSVSLLQRSVAVEVHPAWVRVSSKAWLESASEMSHH